MGPSAGHSEVQVVGQGPWGFVADMYKQGSETQGSYASMSVGLLGLRPQRLDYFLSETKLSHLKAGPLCHR